MSSKLTAAIESLARVRAAETVEPDGLRRVWHQGCEGVDLLSFVDSEGFVHRQELSLFGDHFVWTTAEGVRTGRVIAGEGSAAAHASELVGLDEVISDARIRAANEALRGYRGSDHYIQHLGHVIGFAADGMQDRQRVVITTVNPVTAPVLVPLDASRGRLRIALAIGGALLLVGVAVALLLTR
jgi:hypothetical protein